MLCCWSFFIPVHHLCTRFLSEPLAPVSKLQWPGDLVHHCKHKANSTAKVMVLTHEDAPIETKMPYFSMSMRPVRPLLFMGRAAKRVPPTPVQEAVFDFFKASGIHLGKGISRKHRKN